MGDYYILDGHTPVKVDDVLIWGRNFELSNRRVAVSDPTPNVRVSTVFLGVDHQYGDGPPLIFETLVFGGRLDQEGDRYSTWDEAEAGHKRMVQRVLDSEAEVMA